MRASVLLHLPALHGVVPSGGLQQAWRKLGLILEEEPFDPSSEEEETSRYLLSNRLTLGLSEEEALQKPQEHCATALRAGTHRTPVSRREIGDAGCSQPSAWCAPERENVGEAELPDPALSGALWHLRRPDFRCWGGKWSATVELQPATLTPWPVAGSLSQSQRDGLRAEVVQRVLG